MQREEEGGEVEAEGEREEVQWDRETLREEMQRLAKHSIVCRVLLRLVMRNFLVAS